MAPLLSRWIRQYARTGCALALWAAVACLAPSNPAVAGPKFTNLATARVDANATVALPRTWGPLQLNHDAPIASVAGTINSPFGPSRLVFAQQATPAEGFGLVTVRKSDFEKGAPQYLETIPPRDLAILLNHMESRVHGDRPVWAMRLIRGKAPSQRLLGERRVIYWEGEWHTSNNQIAMVRGYAFFGNGAVYLLRVFGAAGHNQPEFAEEARFADAVAATFRTK